MMNGIYWADELVNAANATRSPTGAMRKIVTAGEQPLWIDRVTFQSPGTNAAAVGLVFVGSLSVGTLSRALLGEIALPAITTSTTARAARQDFDVRGWLLPRNSLFAAVTVDLTGSAGYVAAAYATLARGDADYTFGVHLNST